MKKTKEFSKRFTWFDEETQRYSISSTISSDILKEVIVNTKKEYDIYDCTFVDKLAKFENMMEEYGIMSFEELEKVLKTKSNKKPPVGAGG